MTVHHLSPFLFISSLLQTLQALFAYRYDNSIAGIGITHELKGKYFSYQLCAKNCHLQDLLLLNNLPRCCFVLFFFNTSFIGILRRSKILNLTIKPSFIFVVER